MLLLSISGFCLLRYFKCDHAGVENEEGEGGRQIWRPLPPLFEQGPIPNHLHHEVVRSAWNCRLGKSFGMKETFEFKILRRATVAALPVMSLRVAILTRCLEEVRS